MTATIRVAQDLTLALYLHSCKRAGAPRAPRWTTEGC